MVDLVQQIKLEFQRRFNREPVILCAPGRINLIGEHVDYNEGYVLPAAIDKHLILAMAPNSTESCNIFSLDFQEDVSFLMDDLVPGNQWVNYFMGILSGFKQRNISMGGVDCVFGGTIPSGAGLSSSASLCCGFGFGLNLAFDKKVKRIDLARIAQFAEHQFAGVKCGLMDQYAVLFGEPGAAMLLDCRSMTHQDLPFPALPYTIVLVDTKVKHSLAASAYNKRREACEEGLSILSRVDSDIRALRDVSIEQVLQNQALLGDVFDKCLFVVEEISRTRKAASKLLSNDLVAFGQLMFQSHEGLRVKYEVSCEALDFLVDVSKQNPRMVIGSRMVGGGFGGCTINLVHTTQVENFEAHVTSKYAAAFGMAPEVYPVTISRGVHRIME